ncbi:glycosyltransferase family 4 protein [Deltaproteobacteria bacterium]|nr:glycosyltransferase family 4 protein [Deltaproteobacteria bacterium]
MNILMLSIYFPPHYSGAAKQGLALAKLLRSRGHNIEFVTIRRGDESFEDVHEGFKVWRLAMGKSKHQELGFWWYFLCFMYKRRNDFDILHSHGAYYLNSTIGPLGRLFGKKSIVKTSMAKNDLAGLGKSLSGKVHLFFLKLVDAYVAISKDLQDEFTELKFPEEKVFFLPNGVDTDRFKPVDSQRAIEKKTILKLVENKLVALTIGVFDERKNIGWLIREWINNEGFGTGALLLAVGPQSREDQNGSFLHGLQEIAESRPDLVQIVGHVDRIEEYFQSADFFILPSTNEGMPNVVLEAMSSGLPCVTTKVSGCGDLIEEGVSGYFFPANNSEGLRIALCKILSCDMVKMGFEARNFIEMTFSLCALADQYEHLYLQLSNRLNG